MCIALVWNTQCIMNKVFIKLENLKKRSHLRGIVDVFSHVVVIVFDEDDEVQVTTVFTDSNVDALTIYAETPCYASTIISFDGNVDERIAKFELGIDKFIEQIKSGEF